MATAGDGSGIWSAEAVRGTGGTFPFDRSRLREEFPTYAAPTRCLTPTLLLHSCPSSARRTTLRLMPNADSPRFIQQPRAGIDAGHSIQEKALNDEVANLAKKVSREPCRPGALFQTAALRARTRTELAQEDDGSSNLRWLANMDQGLCHKDPSGIDPLWKAD